MMIANKFVFLFAATALLLSPKFGPVQAASILCSEAILGLTDCIALNCADFELRCDGTDGDTCADVQNECDAFAACCGGCGGELAALLAECTPGAGGTCNIQACNGEAASVVNPESGGNIDANIGDGEIGDEDQGPDIGDGNFGVRTASYQDPQPMGFVETGFINIGFINLSRRQRRILTPLARHLWFAAEWLDEYEDFTWEWFDFWYDDIYSVSGTGNVYSREADADAAAETLITFKLNGGPPDCGDCKVAISMANECTQLAVADEPGLGGTITIDENGDSSATIVFDGNINKNLETGLIGHTLVFGFGNGTAWACGPIEPTSMDAGTSGGMRMVRTKAAGAFLGAAAAVAVFM